MREFSIKDLEKLSGIKAHTLRIWEQRYEILNPKRTNTNIRLYSDKDLKKLLNITILNNNGFKISSISKLSETEIKERAKEFSRNVSENEIQIENLINTSLEFSENNFEKIITSNIIRIGFEETMKHIIFPFIEKATLLYHTNSLNEVQKLFITNLIRQKLFVGIESKLISIGPSSKRILLFLPEGEFNDLEILFINYLLKARNHSTIYLGPFKNIKEISSLTEKFKPDCICTFLNSSPNIKKTEKYISNFKNAISNIPLLISRKQSHLITEKIPLGVFFFTSFDHLIELVNSV